MILEVKNLNVNFKKRNDTLPIIKDVSFNLKENTCLGILGESGSGKSVTCKAIMGLLDKNFEVDGIIKFKKMDILGMKDRDKKNIRGKSICMIMQNPMTAFNPLFTIEDQIIETFREHIDISKEEAMKLSIESLKKMNLNNGEEILSKYPHELSGGMLQRIMIAITIGLEPDLIIADEPTTAIDCINQVEVIKEFKRMKEILNTSMIFITHDLGVLAQVADEVVVMHDGSIVERGSINKIINNPKENHTKYLIDTRLKLLRKFNEVIS